MQTQAVGTKKKMDVVLLGQRFTIRSEHTSEHVQMLTKFVTRQLEMLKRQTKTVSTHQLALLVALNLADELFQRDGQVLDLKTKLRAKTERILKEVKETLSCLPQFKSDAASMDGSAKTDGNPVVSGLST